MAKARLTEIDGLRGVAALAVMLGHWGEFLQKQNAPSGWYEAFGRLFLEDFSFGRLGIVAFFCISGFVVPFSFRGERPLVSFPISRIFRLYPAYWASVITAAVVFALLGILKLTTPQLLLNLTMLQRGLGSPHIISVYWTLTIELMFYAICYVMFASKILYSGRANLVVMCIFLAIALACGAYRWVHPESDLPVGLPTYLAAMHFGTIARLRFMGESKVDTRFYVISTVLLAGGALTANTLAYLHAHNELVGWVAANLGYLVGLVLFLLCIERKWFAGPVFAFLGLISYSMYLFHMIFIQATGALWPSSLGWVGASLLLTPIYFATTVVVATVVQRTIERPGVLWGRQVERYADALLNRLSPKTAAP
jgi:peptidoglycan/LPS O-acetylase OafA/YrhL